MQGSSDRQSHTRSRSKVAETKSIIMRTRSALDQIGNSLSYPASIVPFPPFLQTTNPRPMCQLPSVRRLIRAPPMRTLSFSLLIKSCGSATNCTVLSSTHTRFVHTDSVFVMTLGILIGPLGSTLSVFLYLSSPKDPTSSSNRGSQQIGRWTLFPFSKSRLQSGTQRIFRCQDRLQLWHASSTVYQPLRGRYGRNRRCTSLRSHHHLTADVSRRSMPAKYSSTSHLRGQRAKQ